MICEKSAQTDHPVSTMPPLRVIPAVIVIIVMLLLVACEGPSFMESSHVRPELTEKQREKFQQYLAQVTARPTVNEQPVLRATGHAASPGYPR